MSSAEEEESPSDSQESSLDSDWSENESDDEILHPNRTICWFCQEEQIHLARRRFDELLKDVKNDTVAKNEQQLYKEVFEVGRDGFYAIHLIFKFCGINDDEMHALALSILEFSKEFPSERRTMLSATPSHSRRNPLHWAVYAHAKMEILDALVRAYPEALLKRDDEIQGERTPLELSKRCFPKDDSRIVFLEQMTASWIRHRHRLSVHLCANRYFASTETTTPLVPFSDRDRKVAKIRPKPWFVLSVIGYLLEREMKPLALQILAFAGGNAKVAASKKRRRAASS